jgi:transcriptional regulator with XRE-family HTH domain
MPLVETVVADRVKIKRLAKAREGSVRAFALRIGRHPGSITNMKNGKAVSVKFAALIASELGVDISAITADTEDEPLRMAG